MQEINPENTSRAEPLRLWMKAPMPMVTLFKTFNVTKAVRLRRRGYKFNMLAQMREFYLLPAGDKLMQFDRLAVNVIVATQAGGIAPCDVPFSDNLAQFARDYDQLTARAAQTGQAHELSGDCMVIGTSALATCEIDGAVNIYAGIYNNPFLIWGKYKKKLCKAALRISFQFHHVQMDGNHAAEFLQRLQRELDALKA